MNSRFTFLIVLSLGLIVALGIYIVGDRTQVHYLIIAAGSKQGESYVFSRVFNSDRSSGGDEN